MVAGAERDLEALAARALAEGPSRTIDMLIADALGHAQLREGQLYAWGTAGSTDTVVTAAFYTSSLDAAKRTIPEGFVYYVDSGTLGGDPHACAWVDDRIQVHAGCTDAPNDATALTVSGLRAHALARVVTPALP